MRAQREQVFSGLCHAFNAVPLWGLLFNGYILFTLREESRTVVYHARQAMTFHALLMLGMLIFIALGLVARLMLILSPSFGDLMRQINMAVAEAALIGYVAVCVYGAAQCFQGQPFHYPLLGTRKGS